MSVDVANLAPETLTTALRAGASGHLTAEAAVELLIRHESWLKRTDFRGFVDYHPDPNEDGSGPAARIRWTELLDALESSTLRAGNSTADRILRIAGSLGGGVPVNLAAALPGLGHWHASIVLDALRHAAGLATEHHAQLVVGNATTEG
ncbi:hypothetical protein SUDANB95_07933 (plasmid) [Actinosynnema sp. ALI-1.44]